MLTKSSRQLCAALAVVLGLSVTGWTGQASAQAPNDKIPELGSSTFAWLQFLSKYLPKSQSRGTSPACRIEPPLREWRNWGNRLTCHMENVQSE